MVVSIKVKDLISIIVVTFNEQTFINSIIDEIKKQSCKEFEILVADGGSTDQTVSLANQRGVQVINCKKGKSLQINKAAKKAKGEILFFVHADMKLPNNILASIKYSINNGYDGGGFDNLFDEHNDKIKRITSLKKISLFDKHEQPNSVTFYGDNGIFVKKEVFKKLAGFKEIPIMEGYEFSKRMNSQFKVIKINDPKILVSARRINKSGFWTTRLQWILVHLLYKCGISPTHLAKWYMDVR